MRVRAVFTGWYGNIRRRPDTHTAEFEIARLEDFSHQWMEALDFEPPKEVRRIERTNVDVPVVNEPWVPATLSGQEFPDQPLTKRGPGRPPKAREGEGAGA